ncbi:GlxA family transcriptional regulator [Jatrophihabitans sp. YIM 134969]
MRVAVLAVDGMLDSGFTSVLDVFSAAAVLHAEAALRANPFEVTVVARTSRVHTAHGLSVPAVPWARARQEPPDLLVMPSIGVFAPAGVVDVVRRHPALASVVEWCEAGVGMAAACSGTFFLAEAGLLDGRRATTSWWLADAFRERYPAVQLEDTETVVVDNITTGCAGYGHVDLALALVAQVSPVLADLAAAYLVVGRRGVQTGVPGGAGLVNAPPLVLAFERFARAHLADASSIADIAAAIGTSERTLQRSTADALGMSPHAYLQELRLQQAVDLLMTTERSTASVAEAVGYRSADALRALLRRRRGTSVRRTRAGG